MRLKLLSSIGLVLSIPILLVMVSVTSYISSLIEQSARTELLNQTQADAALLEERLHTLNDQATRLSLSPAIKLYADAVAGGSGSAIDQNTQDALQTFLTQSGYAQVSLHDLSGNILLSRPDSQPATLDPSSLEQLSNGQPLLSGLHRNAPNAHIIARLKGGTGELGQKNLADCLAKTGAVIPDVLLSINDPGSLGAIKTLQNTPQLKNDIAIFSIDGDPQTLADLKDGHYYQGIVTIDPRANADQAVNSAIHQLSGSPFKHILDPGLKPISNP